MKTQNYIKIGDVKVRLKVTSNPNKIILEMNSPYPIKYGEFMDLLEEFILTVRKQKKLMSDYQPDDGNH